MIGNILGSKRVMETTDLVSHRYVFPKVIPLVNTNCIFFIVSTDNHTPAIFSKSFFAYFKNISIID